MPNGVEEEGGSAMVGFIVGAEWVLRRRWHVASASSEVVRRRWSQGGRRGEEDDWFVAQHGEE